MPTENTQAAALTDNLTSPTTKLSGSRELELRHQNLSIVRSNDLLAESRTDRPSLRLIHNFLGVFGTTDRPSPLPSQPTFWALLQPQPRPKPLSSQAIFWALSDTQATLKNECKDLMRSQLTAQITGSRSLLFSPPKTSMSGAFELWGDEAETE